MSPRRPLSVAVQAGGAAALGAAVALSLSCPNFVRPLGLALLLAVGLPGLLGVAFGLVLVWPLRSWAAVLAAPAAAAPWLAIASAPMARSGGYAVLGGLLAIAVAWWLRGARRGAGLGWLAAVVVVAWPPGKIDLTGERSAVLLGFDAATWEEVDRLGGEASLPGFAALRHQGATGVLTSDAFSLSPRVWTTIATGTEPETHGILAFGYQRKDLKAGRIWDEVANQKGTAGVVGWLVNWPPDASQAFSSPGWLTAGFDSVPPEAEFVARFGRALESTSLVPRYFRSTGFYRIARNALAISRADHAVEFLRTCYWMRTGSRPYNLRRPPFALLVARLKTDLFVELLARYRPQFAALVTYPTDSLAHYYWKYHEPDPYPWIPDAEKAEYREVVRDAYRVADATIQQVLARLDLDHTSVIVVSDHGMEANPPDRRQMVINGSALLEALDASDQLLAANSVRKVVLTPREPGPDAEALLDDVHQRLEQATVGEDGKPAFKVGRSHRSQTVSLVSRSTGIPDETLVHIGERSIALKDLCSVEYMSGDHTVNGVLALAGPGVPAEAAVSGRLVDVAPTALHCMGLSVPEELDGEILTGAFTPAWLDQHPPRRRPGPMAAPPPLEGDQDLEAEVTDQLRALGYVR